ALLDRMNVAVALAAGKLPGATVELDSIAPLTTDADGLVTAANNALLGGTMSANTMTVIRAEVTTARDPAAARALAVGLAIGGPDFQRH
ncbi:MAG TPA: hypothetical protein VH116_09020, partial [Gemmatimonadales bacterium]|nr:hypothetical protein [Gemmatimonadales bacterium]